MESPPKENSGEIVRLEDVKKAYRLGSNSVPVLKGINMVVRKGEFAGIMGSSGSGKSTLLNLLGLLDVPTEGKYFLIDREVSRLSDNRLAELRNSCIGFIFQSFNLFPHLNVQQNIEVPLVYAGVHRHERNRISAELAEKVKLGHRLKHRPTELSGGECQRVAVARALSNNPSFLLADEPTGNLDEKTSGEIMELFKSLHREKNATILMVTHNPELKHYFDRVIYLRDGRVVGEEEFKA
ncbi:MAG TPA: macrolide ABC transporter ATP-binding protein [Lentisphaeria bacterium]|nr:MAG: macrolide ABC transporter ATP-binding protein [Lentisphaerae bacterium GWF2_49_21]HBC86820.1 macrolide ABC transporter ATP-binding protein [Lentisphaeria bacterium]